MLRILLTTTILLAGLPAVHANTLLIDAIAEEPANHPQGLLRPRTGMSMASVVKQFGPAHREMPAVGNPPITRWQYPGFTVYFEYNRVINTVIHR